MMIIYLHSAELPPPVLQEICDNLNAEVILHTNHYRLSCQSPPDMQTIVDLRGKFNVDINILPPHFDTSDVKFFISDMDSTLITIECIDEIADYLNIKQQVAAITESAMRGEIDFNTSLTRRVGLLKGLDAGVLQKVYDERLRLSPGAEELLVALRVREVKTALVSGGFTFFTERLKQRLLLNYSLANTLEIIDNKLSGKVLGEIVNADIKAQFLRETCEQTGISTQCAIAIGDGANDLKMMACAGLSIAYRAKPKVQAQADTVFNHSGLDAVLHFLD